MRLLRKVWLLLRQVLGEGAYECYCEHLRSRHPGTPVPSAEEFYAQRVEERYSRPSRCC